MQIHPMMKRYMALEDEIRAFHGSKKSSLKTPVIQYEGFLNTCFNRLRQLKNNQKKVVITGLARSSTGFFKSLLSNHPRHRILTEIFNPNYKGEFPNPEKTSKLIAVNNPLNLVGFKLLLYHVLDYEKFIKNLHKDNWKILALKRNESKKQALSLYLALAYNFYHNNIHSTIPEKKILIDPDLLLKAINLFEISNKELSSYYRILEDKIHIINFSEIKNEDLLCGKLSSIINIPSAHLIPSEKKTLPDKWSLIENSDDVKRIILQD